MSYIDDICNALATVLNRATDGRPERFAGYAANRDFWIAEAAHCLEVIQGYGDRYKRMKQASESSHPVKYDWPTIPISERSMSNSDLSRARGLVREAPRRFLRAA
jgi:hypothetical protein